MSPSVERFHLVGKKAGDDPHLWYSPDCVATVAHKLRDDLKALVPSSSAALDQTTQAFETTALGPYHALIADIRVKYSEVAVGATASIFVYLASVLGLNLVTPPTYLNVVSGGGDISAADEATVEGQITSQTITVLVYNSQNTPNSLTAVINLAKAHAIPVATITETLTPAGATYQQWQTAQLMGIRDALAKATGT